MNHLKIKKNAIMMAMLIIFFSCNKEDAFQLFDLALSNQLVVNVVNIQVVDALNNHAFLDGEIEAVALGDNKGKIYSLEGYKSLSYSNGFLNIGVRPRDMPSVTNPLVFSLRIRHKTSPYLEETVHFTFTSNVIRNEIVRLLNLDALPKGVKAHSIKGMQTGSDNCKTTSDIVFRNEFATNHQTVIKIPSGTRFLDKAGKTLCGEIKGILLSFNYKDTVASFLPGGLNYKAKDPSWTAINHGIFNLYDFFSFEVTVGGQLVHSFSNPCEVLLSKNDSTMRTLETNRSLPPPPRILMQGDDVPTWHLSSKDSAIWTPNHLATVVNDQIIFNISNTGWWNIADPSCQELYHWLYSKFRPPFQMGNFTNALCPTCIPNIKLMVDATINSSYYTEISLKSNPRMIIASPMIEYKDSGIFYLSEYLGAIDKNMHIKMKVFSAEPWNGGSEMASKEFNPCNQPNVNWKQESLKFPQYASITTDFSLKCPDENGRATTLFPTAAIYAKELSDNGSNEAALWSYVGIIRNGKGISMNNQLRGGRMYKFGIFPNSNYAFTTDDIQIKQDNISKRGVTIPQNLNTHISVNFKKTEWNLDEPVIIKCLSPKNYTLYMMDWIPSARTCEGYKRRL